MKKNYSKGLKGFQQFARKFSSRIVRRLMKMNDRIRYRMEKRSPEMQSKHDSTFHKV